MVRGNDGVGPVVVVLGRKGTGEILGLEGNLAQVYVEGRTRIIQVAPDRVRLLDGAAPDWAHLFPKKRD